MVAGAAMLGEDGVHIWCKQSHVPSKQPLRQQAQHMQDQQASHLQQSCIQPGLRCVAPTKTQTACALLPKVYQGQHNSSAKQQQGCAHMPSSAPAGFAPTALADGPGSSLAREELSFIMIKPDGVHRGLIAGRCCVWCLHHRLARYTELSCPLKRQVPESVCVRTCLVRAWLFYAVTPPPTYRFRSCARSGVVLVLLLEWLAL